MAKSGAVWGIDIGSCALKALRCRPHEKDTGQLVVEAFDYVEYPKLLSQPDADREALVREALETFLSRNEVVDDHVAMSVPGQSGLARFIKLPPVESKKIPDIVKYEARQQIPFALEDVVWDYQPLRGGNRDEGFALDTEVGLFAMKRDQVARALEPLERAGLDVEVVQLAPLAVYNYICFDRIGDLSEVEFNPEDPPPSLVVLSLGTDATDMVITNGFRVWQRSIPIGGSHFTKALTKELKLTFDKAEHVKRNPTKAEDPKALFQAMRPVFSNLVSEVQKSLGFYMSNNRKAKLTEIVALGNPMKLPGLQRFLAEQLELPVKLVKSYEALAGGSVTDSSQFKENRLAFGVAYGLCVQGLGRSELNTNLLPQEIVTRRLVQAKKPWAVAAAALLLAGLGANYAAHWRSWSTVDLEDDWKPAISKSQSVSSTASSYATTNATLVEQFETFKTIGESLQSNTEGRLLWPELIKAIDAAMPHAPRAQEGEASKPNAREVAHREELHIESLDSQHYEDVATWFAGVQSIYDEVQRSEQSLTDRLAKNAPPAATEPPADEADPDAAADGEANPDAEVAADEAPTDESIDGTPDGSLDGSLDGAPADGSTDEGLYAEEGELGLEGEGAPAGPTGPGWVIQLVGHHFHNSDAKDKENTIDRGDEGELFVRRTLIRNLQEGTVRLPDGEGGEMIDVPLKDLGISYPVVVTKEPIIRTTYDPNATSADNVAKANFAGVDPMGGFGGGFGRRDRNAPVVEAEPPELWSLRRYNFIVQFVWQPRTRTERREGPPTDEAAVETY